MARTLLVLRARGALPLAARTIVASAPIALRSTTAAALARAALVQHGLAAATSRRGIATAAAARSAAQAGTAQGTAESARGTEGQAADEGGAGAGDAGGAYGEAGIDEPLVARLSRYVWSTIKFCFGMGIVVLVLYAGYTIVVTLLPAGASANAIMRRATAMLRNDPEIAASFGALKTFGEGAEDGRRFYVPEYRYADDVTDARYHRVRFRMEGERGQKAVVFAEVREGTYDFRYLIVLNSDMTRVWTVMDHRPEDRTVEDRQAAVTTLLQDGRVTFYADHEVDISEQAAVLGSYWLKVPVVRCEVDAARCDGDGVTSRPAWRIKRESVSLWARAVDTASNGIAVISSATGLGNYEPPTPAATHHRIVKGVKTLEDLEAMTRHLRKRAATEDEALLARLRRAVGL